MHIFLQPPSVFYNFAPNSTLMKTIFKSFFLVASAAVLASCANNVCKLEGTVLNAEGIENPEVWIFASKDKMDTVAVVDGKFSYSCPIDDGTMYSILLTSNGRPYNRKYSTKMVPDARKLTVVLDTVSSTTGSPMVDLYKSVTAKRDEIYAKEGMPAAVEYIKQAYRDNCDNLVGEKMFLSILRSLTPAEIDELLAVGSDKIKENETIQRVREEKIAADKSGVGKDYIDFSGVTPEGAAVKLSDFIGKSKLTIVDFWASWCGPCMASMPKMVERWNKFHKKGLNIVGVAVWDKDNSKSRVKIAEKGMVWPQIFVGEDRSATDAYGVASIPTIIVISADGKILYRGHPEDPQVDALIAAMK